MRKIAMSNPFKSQPKADDLEAVAFTGPEAAKFTRLSAKTLDRHAEAGEPVGRVKVGRRVVYLKAALAAWLVSKSNPLTISTTR